MTKIDHAIKTLKHAKKLSQKQSKAIMNSSGQEYLTQLSLALLTLGNQMDAIGEALEELQEKTE